MARRPGTYANCYYRGVIRDGRYPTHACDHKHPTPEAARACADEAWGRMKAGRILSVRWYAWHQHPDRLDEMQRHYG